METFDELLNTNDFLDLPNELLDASSYVKVATPIKSPDSNSHLNQILTQPIQIPIEVQTTQDVEPNLGQKSDDQKPKVLKTLDLNTTSSSGRPKRAAALAANSSICSMKRKISNYQNNENNENESDKENVEQGDQKPKAKQIKRRKTTSKKTSPEVQDKSQNISKSEDVSSENIELKESEVVEFLTQRKSFAKQSSVLTQKVHMDNNQKVHMTLHLSCESDPEYDFNNNIVEKSGQDDLNSKLLYPNLCNPKLSEFVVNKPLNNSENSNSNSASVLHTPVKIDKSAVFTVSDNFYYDDSNYEKDELGFTLTRAVEPDLEQHKTHIEYHMEIESEVQALLQENNIQVVDENNNVKNNENSLMYEGVDLLNLDNGKTSDEMIGFAYNVAKVLFSREELAAGIFPTKNGTSRSKNRQPLDNHRTQILKEAIIKKFNFKPDRTEAVWTSIRSDLNKKLSVIKK